MARKQTVVKIPDTWGGRDTGKHFLITEWSAARAEHWAIDAMIAYNRGGGEIPMEMVGGGLQAIFMLGVNTFLRGQMRSEEVKPILDELLECVKIVRDPKIRGPDGAIVATELVSEDDIEEVKTRLWLRSEVIRLHTNFSPADMLSSLLSAVMTPIPPDTSTPPTSPA